MSRKKSTRRPSVDLKAVERLADLSRLSVSPQEANRLSGELSSILDYFAAIDAVNLSKTPQILEAKRDGGMRNDVVRPSNADEVLASVPQRKGRYVRAPRVF